MKQFILAMAVLLMSSAMVSAQDIITKKDGQDIKVKVLEVGTSEVRYRLFEEPEGAIYTVNKSDILLIRYESGRSEVFKDNSSSYSGLLYTDREPVEGIVPGMKYRELKNYYDYRDYTWAAVNRYSPGWCGVASAFIPGLGQMICGEAGRGIAFLAGSIGGNALMTGFANNDQEGAFLFAFIGTMALDIWAIVDGVRVAKVKNMYNQDLLKTYATEFKVYPTVNSINVGNNRINTAGVTFAMSF